VHTPVHTSLNALHAVDAPAPAAAVASSASPRTTNVAKSRSPGSILSESSSVILTGCRPKRRLSNDDPAVRAGRLAVEVISWMVPAGNVRFESAAAPRSMAEAAED
jgi:hypothetical protein